jgi:signal transduction histidine kinase
LQLDPTYFEPRRLFIRSVYLLVVGLLLGYLAEQQKQLRAEKAVIARFLGRARVESGVTGTLQAIIGELLSVYGVKQVVMATQEASNYRIYVAEVRASDLQAEPTLRWLDPSESDKDTFLYDSKAMACYAEKKPGSTQEVSVMALDGQGNKIENPTTEFLGKLGQKYSFQAVMAVSFVFGQEWRGRVFLLDPTLTSDLEEELHFLQELVQQVSPAVYNVLLLRRLRLRAGALERARFARELHDGAVQSLIAVEMQVDVLRRQYSRKPEIIPDELGRIQGLLREEVLKLRELMQQMKTLDVDAKKLPGLINDTVERFQRETGITARFHTELHELKMPQPVCREVARIVQEALVNVRKHSQAKQVLVRLGAMNGNWKVEIEDDGRGFPFSGRFSQDELDSLGKGPVVIKERVRLIEGKLTIESNPGRGSRLEVIVPQQQGAIHG